MIYEGILRTMSKEARCRKIYTVLLHIHQVEEQAKLTSCGGGGNPSSSCPRGQQRGEQTWTGLREHSEAAEVFLLDGVCVTNVTSLKLHLMIYLRCLHFTKNIKYK